MPIGLFETEAARAQLNEEAGSLRDGVKLKVSSLPSPTSSEPWEQADMNVLRAFKKRYPHIELESATGLKLPGPAEESQELMMITGGIAPDVLYLNFKNLATYVNQGVLAPLEPFVHLLSTAERAESADRIPPQVERVVWRKGADGENHLYALPYQTVVMGILYNRELFRLAGLPDRAPRDWDELVQFARAINQQATGNVGLLLNQGAQAAWNLLPFLWSAGGEAVEEVAPDDWRAAYNSDAAVTAYEFYYRLTEAEKIANRQSEQANDSQLRKVGMRFAELGGASNLDPEVNGIGPIPSGPSGVGSGSINARMYGMYSGIKTPEVREAAWKFIYFWGSEEAERVRIKTLVDLGQAAAVSPLQLRRYGYTAQLALLPEGLEASLTRAFKTSRPEPFGKNCQIIYVEMSFPMEEMNLDPALKNAWKRGDRAEVRTQIKAILDRAVRGTNERMLGVVPPEVLKWRRVVAGIAVLAMALFMGLMFKRVMATFSEVARRSSAVISGCSWVPWLLLLPALVTILVWHYIPLLLGSAIAVLDLNLMLNASFVGLDNFAGVLFDPSFWNSLWATVRYAFYTLTLVFLAPILLAYALHTIPRQQILFRTLYYLPAVTSGPMIFFLWFQLFAVDGWLNSALRMMGFSAERAWTADPNLAMLSCILPMVWAGAGPGCLIYLAALKTIPEEQFEAAELDGAGFWGKTIHVVAPGLKPLLIINFVGALAGAFHGAGNILIMTGGGPNRMTEVTALRIFYEAFAYAKFGPATAMAWVLGSMVIGITVFQLRRLSQMEFKTSK